MPKKMCLKDRLRSILTKECVLENISLGGVFLGTIQLLMAANIPLLSLRSKFEFRSRLFCFLPRGVRDGYLGGLLNRQMVIRVFVLVGTPPFRRLAVSVNPQRDVR